MTEPDELAIKQVAIDGHRLKLKKDERLVAIKMMAARGVIPQDMAWRLKVSVDTIQRVAKNAEIELPKAVTPVHWSYNYIFVRDDKRKKQLQSDAARRSRNYKARKRREREAGGSSDMEGTPTR